MKLRWFYLILVFLAVAVMFTLLSLFSTYPPDVEKECFRSIEWFPTATEALKWSLHEAPERVKLYSQFLWSDYNVTSHTITVKPTDKYAFGYDVTIIFYGYERLVND